MRIIWIMYVLLFLVENLWIYAVVGFVLTGGFVIILICYCCCYRSRKSRRQMNHLPSNKVNILIYFYIIIYNNGVVKIISSGFNRY